jgi:hypothetical protein
MYDMEGGGFSCSVLTKRNSVVQYLTRGILLHALRYGRRWFQLASTYQQEFCFMQLRMEGGGFRGKARTNTECTERLVLPFFLYTISYKLKTGSRDNYHARNTLFFVTAFVLAKILSRV